MQPGATFSCPRPCRFSRWTLRDPDLIGELISKQIQDPGRVADIIAPVMEVPVADRQGVLATLDPVARLERVDILLLSDQKSRLRG
jgi:ATP-dependent Lon protease